MGGLQGRHVLVVEDEYLLAEDLRMTLERYGAEVLGPVPSVGEAMASIADHPELDGAVLDMNLRGNMVFPVADMLVARGITFFFTTGYMTSAVPERYAGVTRFEKPFDPEDVAVALGKRLERDVALRGLHGEVAQAKGV